MNRPSNLIIGIVIAILVIAVLVGAIALFYCIRSSSRTSSNNTPAPTRTNSLSFGPCNTDADCPDARFPRCTDGKCTLPSSLDSSSSIRTRLIASPGQTPPFNYEACINDTDCNQPGFPRCSITGNCLPPSTCCADIDCSGGQVCIDEKCMSSSPSSSLRGCV